VALFLDSFGQLVVSATMPVGGSVVSSAATTNLSDTAPWFRVLDDGTVSWHPANYYAADGENPNLITGQLTISACVLPADNLGAVSDYSLATGAFKVWAGTNEVTAL
jgi:hypothetical protein